MMLDLEDLSNSCRDYASRLFLDEAIKCLRIGAYQASVVSIWVAVCFDLFEKIRELSRIGDGRALRLSTQIDAFQRQIEEGNQQGYTKALAFERQILAFALDVELIEHQAFVDLKRLQEDRNRAAHPNFERFGHPHKLSAQHARLHLSMAVEHLLSKPPVQGRAALAQIISNVENDTFIPTDEQRLEIWLRNTPLANGSEPLVRGFVDYAIHDLLCKRPALATRLLQGLMQIRPYVVEQRTADQIKKFIRGTTGQRFLDAAFFCVRLPHALAAIDEADKNRIRDLIAYEDVSKISDILAACARSQWVLRTEVWLRIGRLEAKDLEALIERWELSDAIAERSLELYCESRSWDQANGIASTLILPVIHACTEKQIKNVIDAAASGKGDLLGAFSFRNVLKTALKKGRIKKDVLIRCFEDKGLDKLVTESQDWEEPDPNEILF